MEIIFEALLWICQIVGEFLLQLVFEALAELGLRAIAEPFHWPKPNPWIAAVGYLIYGTCAGGMSIWLFPKPFITSHVGQLMNLAITPLILAATMGMLGTWRKRQGNELLRMDRFSYGYLFALAMALIRYCFTHG